MRTPPTLSWTFPIQQHELTGAVLIIRSQGEAWRASVDLVRSQNLRPTGVVVDPDGTLSITFGPEKAQ